MSLTETALKEYAAYGRDPQRTYRERRYLIRQRLPTLTAYDLQKCVDSLDEQISELKEEIEKLEGKIKIIKREGSAEVYLDGMFRNLTVYHLGMLKLRLSSAVTALKWMQREKKIYLWELRIRKAKSVKVPVLKLQVASLNKKAYELLSKMRSLSRELAKLCIDYGDISAQYRKLETEIALLSFGSAESAEGPVWTNFPAPDAHEALKAFRFLENLENLEQKRSATHV